MNSRSRNSGSTQVESETKVLAASITKLLKQRILEENTNGHLRRDTHAKMYGVVKAIVSVEENLPSELARGIFSEAKQFHAWIRFSNQSTQISDDRQRDIRGMAIKLMDVDGPKLIAPNAKMRTHDLILISPPNFIAASLEEFAGMLSALQGSWWQKLVFFGTHWGLVKCLLQSMIHIANPLQIPYHSTTPYALGDKEIKYQCRPVFKEKDSIPEDASPDFLTEVMKKQLSKEEALFDLCVQIRNDPENMPIENPRKMWSEQSSPWRKVASIRILQQEFDSPAQQQFGENLSFNPWRCLAEHRPLGQINMARQLIYQEISNFRHEGNQEKAEEPIAWVHF